MEDAKTSGRCAAVLWNLAGRQIDGPRLPAIENAWQPDGSRIAKNAISGDAPSAAPAVAHRIFAGCANRKCKLARVPGESYENHECDAATARAARRRWNH